MLLLHTTIANCELPFGIAVSLKSFCFSTYPIEKPYLVKTRTLGKKTSLKEKDRTCIYRVSLFVQKIVNTNNWVKDFFDKHM